MQMRRMIVILLTVCLLLGAVIGYLSYRGGNLPVARFLLARAQRDVVEFPRF